MTSSVWLKAVVVWLVLLVLAILNGGLREQVLVPALGRSSGYIVSGAALSLSIFLVALFVAPWYKRLAQRGWLLLGLFWLLLTVVFEFGFGLYVQHQSWDELLDAYTFREGNIWPVVLVATFISPWLAARMRGL